MTLSVEQQERLRRLLAQLTLGYLSTLRASLARPGSLIGTSSDSAHQALLQQLCDWGMAEAVPLDVDLPPELLATLGSFKIHDGTADEIGALLDDEARRRRH